jgi:hypothetical protein
VDAVARRSCLSVPASDGAKIDKAVTLGADEVDPAVLAAALRTLARAAAGGVR